MMDPLDLQASMDSLSEIARYVCRAGRAAGLDAYRVYQLRLAVDEIASNIILYGYDGTERRGQLRLAAYQEQDCLHIVLEDDGHRFDPAGMPQPNVHLPPDERPEGGLGIYLAQWSVDQVLFEQLAGGNRTTFVIHYQS